VTSRVSTANRGEKYTNGGYGVRKKLKKPSPSMRRPVDVKGHLGFLFSSSLFPLSRAASVAILPSALFGERFSLGASWASSFQQVLLPDNRP
jgi:hypothetical protein